MPSLRSAGLSGLNGQSRRRRSFPLYGASALRRSGPWYCAWFCSMARLEASGVRAVLADIGVFANASASLVCRILELVFPDLVLRRVQQVNIELVGQPYQIDQYVGHFFTDLRTLLLRQ